MQVSTTEPIVNENESVVPLTAQAFVSKNVVEDIVYQILKKEGLK